jgi:transcriptional regulator GlxA family with amidase domain
LVTNASYRIVNRYLNQLFDASFEESWKTGGRPSPATRPPQPIDFRVRKSLRILDDGITEGIELDNVARDAGLSRPHFFKLFRENTGVTPALYANTMRIERALDRLMGTQASVTDIGFELGSRRRAISRISFRRMWASRRRNIEPSPALSANEPRAGPSIQRTIRSIAATRAG